MSALFAQGPPHGVPAELNCLLWGRQRPTVTPALPGARCERLHLCGLFTHSHRVQESGSVKAEAQRDEEMLSQTAGSSPGPGNPGSMRPCPLHGWQAMWGKCRRCGCGESEALGIRNGARPSAKPSDWRLRVACAHRKLVPFADKKNILGLLQCQFQCHFHSWRTHSL